MPSTQTAVHPTGLGITFYEDGHKYQDADGMEYESGTSVVKRFKPEFDVDGSITKRCAEKAGITVDEIKTQWKSKADRACQYGTRVHQAMEFQFKGEFDRIPTPVSPLEQNSLKVIWDMVEFLKSNYVWVASEQIVFSPRLHIAGSIDVLLAEPAAKTLWVGDLKSNEAINANNAFGGKMKRPIEHLDDCALVHYSIQLGLYSRLIRDEGYLEANNMAGWSVKSIIFWVPHMAAEPVYIPTIDVERDIAECLLYRAYDIPFLTDEETK